MKTPFWVTDERGTKYDLSDAEDWMLLCYGRYLALCADDNEEHYDSPEWRDYISASADYAGAVKAREDDPTPPGPHKSFMSGGSFDE